MNADAFRYLYNYTFSENRKVWDEYITHLPFENFIQEVDYSHGSLRNQLVHMMDAAEMWFCELRNVTPPEPLPNAGFDDRQLIRKRWDEVEQMMRVYLAELRDDMLGTKPITFEDDKNLTAWQVLLHVVNHDTDHRAQLLRVLHDMGVKTTSQDFIFYVYDHP